MTDDNESLPKWDLAEIIAGVTAAAFVLSVADRSLHCSECRLLALFNRPGCSLKFDLDSSDSFPRNGIQSLGGVALRQDSRRGLSNQICLGLTVATGLRAARGNNLLDASASLHSSTRCSAYGRLQGRQLDSKVQG